MFLEVRDLSINLGEFSLKRVSLSVRKNEYLVLIGPTGSGKSILLETIAGFYSPTTGRIFLEGKDITFLPPEMRNVSVVYQDYMLFPHMSVEENIAYGLKKKVNNDKIITEEVKKVSIILKINHLLHRRPETLSGGEQQRVAIARALVVRPKILLMDEPFSALDVKTKEFLRTLVKKAVEEYQTTVLHVTHDFDDVFTLASRVAVLHQGKILQVGTPEEIFSNPVSDFVANFVGTNIIHGTVISTSTNGTAVKCKDSIIYTTDQGKIGEDVTLTIRPENIIISREKVDTSARNVMIGKVVDISTRGHVTWVYAESKGIKFKIVITPNSAELLKIKKGVDIYLIFKASAVKIVR